MRDDEVSTLCKVTSEQTIAMANPKVENSVASKLTILSSTIDLEDQTAAVEEQSSNSHKGCQQWWRRTRLSEEKQLLLRLDAFIL